MPLIRSEALFSSLRSQQHAPYIHFSDQRRAALGDVLRVFELRAGDSIALATNSEHVFYISVIDGIAAIEEHDG